jgi:Fe-S cluster biogenesis protein NfuA
MAAMTLRNSVEKEIRGRYPDFLEIVDVTNHDDGTAPYYERTS